MGPRYCISCTSDILPYWNRHRNAKEKNTTPTNVFYYNELFQLIKNLHNIDDETSNGDTNSLNGSNLYRDPDNFCNLESNIKSKSLWIFHEHICPLSRKFNQVYAHLTERDIYFDLIGITESSISKTNLSSTNIALENYTIGQTPSESNAGRALLYINSKIQNKKLKKNINYANFKKPIQFLLMDPFTDTMIVISMFSTQII